MQYLANTLGRSFIQKGAPLLKTVSLKFFKPSPCIIYTSSKYFSSQKDGSNNKKVYNSDKEFEEAVDQIDINAEESEEVFQSNEQALSIKLLSAKSSRDVLDLFEDFQRKRTDLKVEEYCLVLYFACYYKGQIVDDPRFHKIIKKIVEDVSEVSQVYLFTLVHSLGIYCFEFGLTLSPEQQKVLGEHLLQNIKLFELNQVSAASWSISHIVSASENQELRNDIISSLTEIMLNHAEVLTGLDYANILSTYSYWKIKETPSLEKLIESISKIVFKFEAEDLNVTTRLVLSLGEINLKNSQILIELYDIAIKPQIPNFSVEDIASLLLIYSDKRPTDLHILRELIKNIHVNVNEISITSYLNVWLALAKYKVQPADMEKTINLLKQGLFKNKYWKIKDLEAFEAINLIISLSTLKVNDKEFLKHLVEFLEPSLTKLENQDLVNLARAFLIYIKQYEEFYLKIHQECVNRYVFLSEQERKLLSDAFTKARSRLPSSPFIDPSL